MNENLIKLHNNLTNNVEGFSVPIEIFQQDMLDPNKLEKLHSNLPNIFEGFNVPINQFQQDLGLQPLAPIEEPKFIDEVAGFDVSKQTKINNQEIDNNFVDNLFGDRVDNWLNENTPRAYLKGNEKVASILGKAATGLIGTVIGTVYGIGAEGFEELGLKEEDGVNQIFNNQIYETSNYIKSLFTQNIPNEKSPEKIESLADLDENYFSNPAFWYNQGSDGISSLLEFLVPGSQAAKLPTLSKGLSKIPFIGKQALDYSGKLVRNSGKFNWLTQKAVRLADNAPAGFALGAYEGIVEGSHAFDDIYDKGIAKGLSEEEAKRNASNAASEVWKQNAKWLTLTNLFEIDALFKNVPKSVLTAIPTILGQTIAEGFEEGIQFGIGEYVTDKYIKDNDKAQGALKQLIKGVANGSPEAYESIILGAAIGGGSTTISSLVSSEKQDLSDFANSLSNQELLDRYETKAFREKNELARQFADDLKITNTLLNNPKTPVKDIIELSDRLFNRVDVDGNQLDKDQFNQRINDISSLIERGQKVAKRKELNKHLSDVYINFVVKENFINEKLVQLDQTKSQLEDPKNDIEKEELKIVNKQIEDLTKSKEIVNRFLSEITKSKNVKKGKEQQKKEAKEEAEKTTPEEIEKNDNLTEEEKEETIEKVQTKDEQIDTLKANVRNALKIQNKGKFSRENSTSLIEDVINASEFSDEVKDKVRLDFQPNTQTNEVSNTDTQINEQPIPEVELTQIETTQTNDEVGYKIGDTISVKWQEGFVDAKIKNVNEGKIALEGNFGLDPVLNVPKKRFQDLIDKGNIKLSGEREQKQPKQKSNNSEIVKEPVEPQTTQTTLFTDNQDEATQLEV